MVVSGMNTYALILKDFPDEFGKFENFTDGWVNGGMTESDFYSWFNDYLRNEYQIVIRMENLHHKHKPWHHTKASIIPVDGTFLNQHLFINLDYLESWDYTYKEILTKLLNKLWIYSANGKKQENV